MWRKLFRFSAASVVLLSIACAAQADDTFVYAVQISAVLSTNPPAITMSWVQDPYGAVDYSVYRKSEDATNWGPALVTLDGSITNFTDTNVQIGTTYEYQIIKDATLGYIGYGYIYSGIGAPLLEERGTLILVVATNSAIGLSNELSQLQTDLTGDGWVVICEDVSSNDTPEYVRSLIMDDYSADPSVNAVFLFGHVPILESGWLNYDGHYWRAMPADCYYGEMNDDWIVADNPTNGPSYLPSDVALEVGRVDMFDMIGEGASVPWPNEQELLRNYLNKDHAWRYHQIQVERRALMGDRRGDIDGPLAMAASGYRAFTPFVGASNIIQANIQDDAPAAQRWISMLASGSYLWAFGDGGGEPNGITYLGTNGEYDEVLSTDVVGVDAQAVFVMLFGSYFGNWDDTDDIMRSVLATPTMGLACFMSGEPHWFVHHMGLGETIGYGTRLTMNNSNLYQNASNIFTRAVYIALMGDPALRQDPVAPPVGLSASPGSNSIALNWSSGPDPVLGYNIYRSPDAGGPYVRLNGPLIGTTTFTDSNIVTGTYYYLVRGVLLQTTPSGSYYNASEGVFASASIVAPLAPIQLGINSGLGNITLNWNSVSGVTYRVLATASLSPPAWTNVSGTLSASGPSTAWIVPVAPSNAPCYYQVATP